MVTNEQIEDIIDKVTTDIIHKHGYAFTAGVLMHKLRAISCSLEGHDRDNAFDILKVHVAEEKQECES